MSRPQSHGLPLPTLNAAYKNDTTLTLITTAYIMVSVFAVFINKYLTTASEYKFHYSSVTVLLQLIIALCIVQLWKCIQSRYNTTFRLSKLSWTGWQKVWPCTGMYMALVLLDPLYLTRVPASMYTSVHASCLLFTLTLGVVLGRRRKSGPHQRSYHGWLTNTSVWSSCLVQYFGIFFAGSSSFDVALLFNSSWIGLCYTLLMATLAYSVQKSLVELRNDISQFLQWHLIMATVTVLPLTIISGDLSSAYHYVLFFDEPNFWIQMVVGSVLAMLIHTLMALLISISSPLTYAVASTTKTCLQAIFAMLVFRNSMSGYQLICLSISLVGALCYSRSSNTKHVNSVYSM
ncbi:unnamed protein product [Absidia cylindrospora]